MHLPDDIEKLKIKVNKILHPIASAIEKGTKAEKDFLFKAVRTDAGKNLPPYYLVYFLFVELLGYKNLGRFEKIDWSIPIDFNGIAYLIEHRKFGLGLFSSDKNNQGTECQEIVMKIIKAVKIAQPYFEWLANEAAKRSDLNVLNHSLMLYGRYLFFINEYKSKKHDSNDKKNIKKLTEYSKTLFGIHFPFYNLKREAEWLAISAIDSFYSFTEHVFLHAAILQGILLTGEDVLNFADADWPSKFKTCLNIKDQDVKDYYDQLVLIKRQIRNYVAHGAFGKNGEAFQIHSGAGAVPLLMPHQRGNTRFSMQNGIEFKEEDAIQAIEDFMEYYWGSKNFPETIYIQSGLPTILPYASDSTYRKAMESIEDMENFVDYLTKLNDDAANMDW